MNVNCTGLALNLKKNCPQTDLGGFVAIISKCSFVPQHNQMSLVFANFFKLKKSKALLLIKPRREAYKIA